MANNITVSSNNHQYRSVTEGKATVLFPMASAQDAFYNPVQEFNRDMSIAAIRTWSHIARNSSDKKKRIRNNTFTAHQLPENKYRVLEALSASGLRSIRYAREMPDLMGQIIANDLMVEAVESIRRNVEHNQCDDVVIPNHADALDLMYSCRSAAKQFHIVDLDPYGSAAPFLDAAVQSVVDGGLLCVTCTDSAVLCGKYPLTSYAKYGSMTIANTDYCHEMSLRVLINACQTAAGRYRRQLVPLMSCSIDFYIRIFFRVVTSAEGTRLMGLQSSMMSQCSRCPSFSLLPLAVAASETADGSQIKSSPSRLSQLSGTCSSSSDTLQDGIGCRFCGNGVVHVGGPIYSGPLHDPEFVAQFVQHLSSNGSSDLYGTRDRMLGMASVISEELLDAPFYYKLANFASTCRASCPPLAKFFSAVLNAGYRVSASHCQDNTLKTDAPPAVMWLLMVEWAKSPTEGSNPVQFETFPEDSVARRIANWVETAKSTPGHLLSSIKVDFTTEHPDAIPKSKQLNLVRYQQHYKQNWGPKARVKGTMSTTVPSAAKKRPIDEENER